MSEPTAPSSPSGSGPGDRTGHPPGDRTTDRTTDRQASALAAHRALVRALARPDRWPQALPAGTRVERIETHISSLLLAGDGVIKLKKPVVLPFVDFGSVERRRHFCHEELRLSRRTAPDLYRAVLPVRGPADDPRLGAPAGADDDTASAPGAADDAVIDWVVWMRRFDATGLFDRMADEGRLGTAHVDALADEIGRFHATLPPSPAGFGDPDHLMRWVDDNLRELQALLRTPAAPAADCAARVTERRSRMTPQVDSLAAWSAARGQALRPLLAQRRAGGAVVEGHGDMHLGNIVWHDGRACLFDALEFAPDLRHADRLADLAFPFMDLLDHGLPRLAWRLLARVLDASGDHDGLPLLRWLAAYRALVRAKVALLSAQAGGADRRLDADRAGAAHATAERRVALAHALAHPTPPSLVLTCGLSGSGKSTVALMLAESMGALRVRSDVERKRLHGLAPTARVDDPARLYGADSTRRTYDRLLAIAEAALAGGVGVVLDAAYLRRAERDQARALAARLGVPFAIVECHAPDGVLADRIRRRQAADHDPSDADLAVLARQQAWQEPPQADEPLHRLDTARPLAALDRAVDDWACTFNRDADAATPGDDTGATTGEPDTPRP
jgi:aminoglycoside phosphotransferase family enzyme/predicted kinase